MLSAKVKKAARELGFKNKYGVLYGTADGYVVSLADTGKRAELFIDARVAQLPAERAQSLRDGAEEVTASYGADGVNIGKTGLCVTLPADKKRGGDFSEFLYSLINQLKIAGAAGAAVCSNCGKDAEGDVVKVGTRAHSCCAACAQRIVANHRRMKDKSKKHPFAGFFGALFASVVGLAPWVYLNYAGYYALPALFLVPLAASLGYRIFGGKPCAAKAVIVTLLSLLAYAAGCLLMLCWSVYSNWWNSGYTFSRAEVFDAVAAALRAPDAAMLAFLKTNAAMGLVFIALGLLFVLPGALRSKVRYAAMLTEANHG